MNDEVGRELAVSDLVPKTIVVIAPPGRPDILTTVWVTDVSEDTVTFYAGDMRWTAVNFIRNGRIIDDQEREVKVFQYLGEQ